METPKDIDFQKIPPSCKMIEITRFIADLVLGPNPLLTPEEAHLALATAFPVVRRIDATSTK